MPISEICYRISPILNIIGQLLRIFQISLPIILIVMGIYDISKFIITSDKEKAKKNLKNYLQRILVSIMIFFIPMLCMSIFNLLDGFKLIIDETGIDYNVCYNCLFNPSDTSCKNAIELAKTD